MKRQIIRVEPLASLLEQGGYEVVGQAGDGSELLQIVRECRPDLALLDIRMPPAHRTEGLEAARLIRDEFPDMAILLLSPFILTWSPPAARETPLVPFERFPEN